MIKLSIPGAALRPVRESDVADVQLCCNDEGLAYDVGSSFPSPYTLEHAHEFVKMAANPVGPRLHLCVALNDRLVGMMGIVSSFNEHSTYAEVGYWTGRHAAGRGLASAGLDAYCAHIFDTFAHVNRIEALTFPHNTASQRVLEKAGFVREAILKGRARTRDGKIVDDLIYARLRLSH